MLASLPLVVAVAAILVGWAALNLAGVYFRDAMAYWRPDFQDLYGGGQVGVISTYLYSPAFAQLMWPFGLLPWEIFAAIWSATNLAVLVWMVGPYLAAILLWVPGPVADEISTGNIHLLLAAAVVVGFRHHPAWAFPLLTKVTPGVAVLWLAGARQWRALAVAVGTTLVIVAVSVLVAPTAWLEWLELLRRSATVPVAGDAAVIPAPLWLRVTLAAVVALAAGVAGIRWALPMAAALALPVLWSSGLSMLVGSLALTRAGWESLAGHAWTAIRRAPSGLAAWQRSRQ